MCYVIGCRAISWCYTMLLRQIQQGTHSYSTCFVMFDIKIDEIANIYNGDGAIFSWRALDRSLWGWLWTQILFCLAICWRSLTGSYELENGCRWYHTSRRDKRRLRIPVFRLAEAVEMANGETYPCEGFSRRSSFSSFCTALSATGFLLLYFNLHRKTAATQQYIIC